ncbi:MAG: glycine cleavage system protein GcvH [Bdellovibrionales bacterium]|nr:glycine cleavage system protein GcvH [Bdellovibrionales bacterium]
MEIPDNLRYTKEHEWVEFDPKNKTAKIGITEYAQDKLGDIVHIDLPEEGDTFNAHDTFGSVESVKAVSDIYTPISGKVLEVNETVLDGPEMINEDPYSEGWMVMLSVKDTSELESLMDASAYEAYLEELE